MKNKFVFMSVFSLLSIILIISAISSAASFSTCNPEIKLINQDPTPAIPNDYVKVIFEVSNMQDCNGLAVKLNPEYPFSLDPGYNPIQTISGDAYTVGYKSTWTIPYKIRIAQDALNGDYNLKLLYHQGIGEDFSLKSVEQNFNISIIDAQTEFDVVVQEAAGTQVSLGIVNIGKNTANSLIVGVPQQNNFMATGTSEQIVGNLAAGDYTLVTFSINSVRQANTARNRTAQNFNNTNFNPQDSSLKIKIDYTDGIGKRRSIIKEILLNGFLLQGNSTAMNFQGRSRSNQTTSSTPTWLYGAIILVILIIGFFVYKKYGNKIKNLYKQKFNEKNSNDPDWVSAERTPHKK